MRLRRKPAEIEVEAAALDTVPSIDPTEYGFILADQDLRPIPIPLGQPGGGEHIWRGQRLLALAQDLIDSGEVPSNGYGFPARELMPASHYYVSWAARFGGDPRYHVFPRRGASLHEGRKEPEMQSFDNTWDDLGLTKCTLCGEDGHNKWHCPKKVGSLQVEAHDSGDGETIYHCPFCGSGNVVGRSDGSAECGFCDQVFTVQVQPQHPFTPQTIDGKPYNDPNMPGEPGVPGEQTDQQAAEGDTTFNPEGEMVFTPPAQPEQPVEQPPAQPVAASLRTSAGMVLDMDHVMQHYALLVADDRDAVLERVRAENAG